MSRRKIYLPHVECQYRSALGCCVLVEVCPEGRYIYLMWNVNMDQPWDVVFWWCREWQESLKNGQVAGSLSM